MLDMLQVLLLEPDALLCKRLASKLKIDGLRVSTTGSLRTAMEADSKVQHDIYILNAALPDGRAHELVRELNNRKDQPAVLMVIDEASISKTVECFRFGADDVLTKPVHYQELIARIQAVLKRTRTEQRELLQYQDIVLDLSARTLTKSNELIELSAKEFAILKVLLKHPGFIFSKSQLEDKIYQWGGDVCSNTIEVHISHLRKKLGKGVITTFRGMGYTIKAESHAERSRPQNPFKTKNASYSSGSEAVPVS